MAVTSWQVVVFPAEAAALLLAALALGRAAARIGVPAVAGNWRPEWPCRPEGG